MAVTFVANAAMGIYLTAALGENRYEAIPAEWRSYALELNVPLADW